MFSKIVLDHFTAFKHLEMEFTPGINVLIGVNGTGKTHILKALYAAAEISESKENFAAKINKVFLPSNEHINRLVKREVGRKRGSVDIFRKLPEEEIHLRLAINSWEDSYLKAKITGHTKKWLENPISSVLIPVKEMLANAPGFKSLYETRNIHFEEVYADIITKALLPPLRGPADAGRRKINNILEKAIAGKITVKNEEFYLKNKQGNLEFTLLAEGLRKLGLLWILIQNGILTKGSVLFWDEPEANLNPKLIKVLVEIFYALAREGQQIIIATHNYNLVKWIDLFCKENERDILLFHSLYKEQDEIKLISANNYLSLEKNPIADAFNDIFEGEAKRMLGSLQK